MRHNAFAEPAVIHVDLSAMIKDLAILEEITVVLNTMIYVGEVEHLVDQMY